MRDKIEQLLDKYWEGNTSLEEEKELRELMKQYPGFEQENLFFQGVSRLNNIKGKPLKGFDRKKTIWFTLFKYAAVLMVAVSLSWLSYSQYIQYQQRKAYEQVMQAFLLIQENLEKGTSHTSALEDLKHLSAPHDLFNIDEIKEK